jgi:beta-glucosidase-like glycosyl hydrolase
MEDNIKSADYWNKSLPIDSRVSDLLSRMTLEEKAGQLFQTVTMVGPNGTLAPAQPFFNLSSTEDLLSKKFLTHFNLMGQVEDARTIALWHNNLQQYVREHTRLGIPVTLSSDPRNHFVENIGTGFQAGIMSLWPEFLGFAALRDVKLVEKFANIARQEYLALGLRVALHPQVDLATEYRWSRINNTFGEDAELTGELVQGYIRGFQDKAGLGLGFGPHSVSTMTKHFPGGGPQLDGEDPHFEYGREQVYPGHNFRYHLEPFKKAIAAGTRQIMPYYGMPVGTKYEEVGFAFSREIVTDLLRGELGFDGIICTDWGLVTDVTIMGQPMPARAWGCENLTPIQRVQRILEAGCDQFGGDASPELVVQLVGNGLVSMARIDESVRRLLREKFALGLFDNPFVDVNAASKIVGQPAFVKEGELAQRRSYTLLKNDHTTLPLSLDTTVRNHKVYVEGIDPLFLQNRGLTTVPSFKDADIAILRLKTPYEQRPGGFEAHFHAGSLAFPSEEQARQAEIFQTVPVSIVDIYLDRPAVIPEIAASATALLANYGSSADALLDVVFGVEGARPEGRLPFDLPRSMAAVCQGRSDVPFDTENPVYRFGDGLKYEG